MVEDLLLGLRFADHCPEDLLPVPPPFVRSAGCSKSKMEDDRSNDGGLSIMLVIMTVLALIFGILLSILRKISQTRPPYASHLDHPV